MRLVFLEACQGLEPFNVPFDVLRGRSIQPDCQVYVTRIVFRRNPQCLAPDLCTTVLAIGVSSHLHTPSAL